MQGKRIERRKGYTRVRGERGKEKERAGRKNGWDEGTEE